MLLIAKTQRWAPGDVLRILNEAEIASRDASHTRARLKAAAFPVIKTIEAKENLALIGPAGTG